MLNHTILGRFIFTNDSHHQLTSSKLVKTVGGNYNFSHAALVGRQRSGAVVLWLVNLQHTVDLVRVFPFVPTAISWIGHNKLFVVLGPFATVITQRELLSFEESLLSIKRRLEPVSQWFTCVQNLCFDGRLAAATTHNNRRFFFGRQHYWVSDSDGIFNFSNAKTLTTLRVTNVDATFSWEGHIWFFSGGRLRVATHQKDGLYFGSNSNSWTKLEVKEVRAAITYARRVVVVFHGCCWQVYQLQKLQVVMFD